MDECSATRQEIFGREIMKNQLYCAISCETTRKHHHDETLLIVFNNVPRHANYIIMTTTIMVTRYTPDKARSWVATPGYTLQHHLLSTDQGQLVSPTTGVCLMLQVRLLSPPQL